ncbi:MULTISPECIES: maleylpyruvate isomerase N-terminal domain-containing protein [Rhizobium/Agrobacterium group]|uniref:maleylpyruvate isomerase N-terminal domain-containing protein n=1 Tax=Rhizobium/Agrobacterium group TaxID=227290 RepID=UPI0022B84802|nr:MULTISPECIES: maleylpyruvate isomerase N-terminal domain-containing protein [Rhizobium/Agrobacterium group]MCZ7889959.1 maleylpyruvate isomerase N-terminal domain-containing protein [Agrobacterium salinitolerans]MDA5636460.1 maleylpyruvate isomerase N-terminal domain-containing protein [Agrobacterium sp. ST15.16.024]MDF1892324.1 maleylpyruvate isomerase N-terminal domain-containing protein [Rhizobium rhizogenes]
MKELPSDFAPQESLRQRLGKGARFDAPGAPRDDLLMLRRGTAFFARKLNELSNEALYGPAARPGWSRAHVVANLCFKARRMAQVLEAIHNARETPSWDMNDEPKASLDLAATLPSHALRHLFQHSEIHLNVCFRDLTDSDWARDVTAQGGNSMELRAFPLMRARNIWQQSVILNNGALQNELPTYFR